MSAYGPRASILRVGACEPLDEGVWYLNGWKFDIRGDLTLVHPCPFVHDADGAHIGFLGWLFSELKALSDEQMALGMLPTQIRPS